MSSKMALTLISPSSRRSALDFLKIRPVPAQRFVNFSISTVSALGVAALGSMMVTFCGAFGSLENFITITYRPLFSWARTGCFLTDSTNPANLVFSALQTSEWLVARFFISLNVSSRSSTPVIVLNCCSPNSTPSLLAMICNPIAPESIRWFLGCYKKVVNIYISTCFGSSFS